MVLRTIFRSSPPPPKRFQITLRHSTLGRIPSVEWSDAETSLDNKQLSQDTDIHDLYDIQSLIPNKRATADPSLSPHNHWYCYITCKLNPSGDTQHRVVNTLNPELNPIWYLLTLLGAHHFLHVSRIRVKLLTFRLLILYMYGAPILDVSRSHTTTQHSR